MELEELTTQIILGMKKATLILDAFINDREINKENLSNNFIKFYRAQKIESIKEKLKSTRTEAPI